MRRSPTHPADAGSRRLAQMCQPWSMPSSNLDLVRSICAAWEQGGYSSAGWAHSEIPFRLADGPDLASSMGMGGMVEYTRHCSRSATAR